MYLPEHFKEADPGAMHRLIRSSPLATLVVSTSDGLVVDHLPFLLDTSERDATKLLAHVPRANPLSRIGAGESACVAVFHGPQGYVSPSWYATKPAHGKVVPTWNYAVVHAHGGLTVIDDAAWVGSQITRLTEQQEGRRSPGWAVTDAPADYIRRLTAALVGVEIRVARLEGKTKASQNQPAENQRSLLAALDREQPGSALTGLMRSVLAQED